MLQRCRVMTAHGRCTQWFPSKNALDTHVWWRHNPYVRGVESPPQPYPFGIRVEPRVRQLHHGAPVRIGPWSGCHSPQAPFRCYRGAASTKGQFGIRTRGRLIYFLQVCQVVMPDGTICGMTGDLRFMKDHLALAHE